ncbi:AEC family transporter [Paraburkholderia largidicola]|uniref:Malonate decarboxylase n=1 Tax=Paraburkholderia largidicola TaxID=3014751 RepID=A0A7I8BVC1_9BURK|nr:AEC family transporter [Paraburkholderia sp. PGU16]BCF92747.1 malonate decarboxylase [Paraburkholderia sp. PGU16]
MLSVLALALAPTFFVMALGYGAGKTGHINNFHVKELNTVVMSYCLPASLFVATATSKWSDLIAQWPILLSLSITMMGVYVLWYVYQRWARRQNSSEAALQALAVGQPNYAAAAFPVITALFGAEHLSTVAVGIAVGSLLPSPLTLALLELDRPTDNPHSINAATHRHAVGARPKPTALTQIVTAAGHALSKPIVLAPVFGMLVSLSGWHLPNVAAASLREIGVAAGGMGLLVTGVVLSQSRFRLTLNTAFGVCVSNIAQALLAFLICRAVNASADITRLAVIMAALPSGFFGILFGNSYDRLSGEANSTIIASTLFSALTLAIAIAWSYTYGG